MVTGFERDIWKNVDKIERWQHRQAIAAEYATRAALLKLTGVHMTTDQLEEAALALAAEFEEALSRA